MATLERHTHVTSLVTNIHETPFLHQSEEKPLTCDFLHQSEKKPLKCDFLHQSEKKPFKCDFYIRVKRNH